MPPVINPLYPIVDIGSIEELMDIATGMEHEAARRYDQLAAMMDTRGDREMVTLFRCMAELERDHQRGIGRWAEREGRRRPLPAQFGWRMPETFDDDDVASLTPYVALGIAVRNEERAFAFYTYLAALAPNAVIRERAEALAREELNHVAELRKMRRKAFHLARPPTAVRRVHSIEELRALAEGLAQGSAVVEAATAAALDRAGEHDSAALFYRAEPLPERSAPGSTAAEGARAAGMLAPGAFTPGGALALALRDADEVVAAFLAIADQAHDEGVIREAQRLAEHAIGRAALIRTVKDQRDRSEDA
jgi:rubrerythrin